MSIVTDANQYYGLQLGGVRYAVYRQSIDNYTFATRASDWDNGLCIQIDESPSSRCCIVPDDLATCIKQWLKNESYADMTLQEYVDIMLYKDTPSKQLVLISGNR